MERKRVNSSKLRSVGYDEKTMTLEVEMSNGQVYQSNPDGTYSWIPDVATGSCKRRSRSSGTVASTRRRIGVSPRTPGFRSGR